MTPLTFKVFDEKEIERIETTAFRLLEEVGIALEDPLAREKLLAFGCRPDGGRICMPRARVEAALQSLNRDAHYWSADGTKSIRPGRQGLCVHNGGAVALALEHDTGACRRSLLRDVADAARMADALDNVQAVTPMFGPADIAPEMAVLESFAAVIRNTAKPVISPGTESGADVHVMLAMIEACRRDPKAFRANPTLSFMVSPISPLRFSKNTTDAIVAIAEAGAQLQCLPCPMMGTTSPITLAGALAQQHAENLAAFAIAGIVRPGTRVLYSARLSPIDLRSATSVWGGPEAGLAAVGAVQLAHHAGFVCDTYGLNGSAVRIDAQFGFERMPTALLPILAGGDVISGVGMLANATIGSLTALVIDDEIISMLRQLYAGVEVTDATLAFDLSREVLHENGVFLDREETVEQLHRGCFWVPKISERPMGEALADLPGVVARARDKENEILRMPRPRPLPESAERLLTEILDDERRRRARK